MKVRPKGTKDELKEKLALIRQISPTVHEHYMRMRGVYPCPMVAVDIYTAVVPAKLLKMFASIVDEPTGEDESWAQEVNFRSLMTMGTQIVVALDREMRAFKAVHGAAHLTRVFWVKLPFTAPVPTQQGNFALVLPELSRHRHMLGEWYFSAARFSRTAEADVKLIREVIEKSRLPEVLERVWPELLTYARMPRDKSRFDVDMLLEVDSEAQTLADHMAKKAGSSFTGSSTSKQVEAVMYKYGVAIDAVRARVSNTMATASLVTATEPVAWVGWPMK